MPPVCLAALIALAITKFAAVAICGCREPVPETNTCKVICLRTHPSSYRYLATPPRPFPIQHPKKKTSILSGKRAPPHRPELLYCESQVYRSTSFDSTNPRTHQHTCLNTNTRAPPAFSRIIVSSTPRFDHSYSTHQPSSTLRGPRTPALSLPSLRL